MGWWNVLELDSDDGCTTFWICRKPLKWNTLKEWIIYRYEYIKNKNYKGSLELQAIKMCSKVVGASEKIDKSTDNNINPSYKSND